MIKKWRISLILLTACLAIATQVSAFGRVRFSVGYRARGPVVVSHVRVGPPVRIHSHPFYARPYLAVRPVNAGSVDFNVEPKDAEIYIDGAYLGLVKEYDGGVFGSTAVLPAGTHRVRIVAPNGQVVQRKIYVMPGRELNFNMNF